jgi:hypothetical protein
MKYFNLLEFPKFLEEYESDSGTWYDSLKRAGYSSVDQHGPFGRENSYSMSDEHWTWFILRFL